MRRIPERFLSQPFRVADALDAGVTRRQLAGPRFRRVFHGVRVAAALPESLGLRCAAAELILPSGAAFAGLTAAAVAKLPVPPSAEITARVPPGERRPQVIGMRILEGAWAPESVVTYRGRRITTGPQTLLDCAAGPLDERQLIILGDAMLNRGWTDVTELREFIARCRRRHGVRALRTAVPQMEPRAQSPGETRARLNLVSLGFPSPLCGVVIYDEMYGWVAEVDMVVEDPPVVFQYDGEPHWRSDAQRRSDVIRDESVRDLGWEVIVLTSRDNRDLDRLDRRVRAAFTRAQGRTPRGYFSQPPLPHARQRREAS